MKSILSQYPRIVYLLVLFVSLQQLTYFLLNAISSRNLNDSPLFAYEFGTLMPILEVLAVVAGGWIADKAKGDAKNGMMTSVAVMLFGGIVTLLPFPGAELIGNTVVSGANTTFLVLVYLQLAMFFPVADDWKDNGFMLLSLAMSLATLICTILLSVFYLVATGLIATVIPLASGALLIGLLNKSKDIGFRVEEDEDEEKDAGDDEVAPTVASKWGILLGITLLATIAQGAVVFFPQIGNGKSFLLSQLTGIIGALLLSLIVLIGGAWMLLQYASSESRQYTKICWGIIIFFGAAAVEFFVRFSGLFEVDSFSDNLPHIVYNILWLPAMLAALTHVNFDKQAGLWLGIFLGAPQLVLALAGKLDIYYAAPLLVPGIFLLLLIATLIWLRENRTFILNLLRLDQPNFEVENQDEEEDDDDGEDEDIIDHLIDARD